MEVQFSPDVQARLDQLVAETGRRQEDLVCDALTSHFAELAQIQGLLNNRYDDLKSGRVELVTSEQVETRFDRKSAARRA